MAQFTNDSTLNSAIQAARNNHVEIRIDNYEIGVYWTPQSSVEYLYSRLNRFDMAELLRDLREAMAEF